MITVEQASQIIQSNQSSPIIESVALDDAIGRVLQEDLIADRDFPPYDRVTMDGIAIAYQDVENGCRSFPVQEIAAAGSPQKTLSEKGHCLEVMTGAILPKGCDTVIRYEDLEIADGSAQLQVDGIRHQQNVHHQASDRAKGSLLVKAGVKLSSAEIGIAATIGAARLKVSRLPKVVIISTGDELVTVDQQPLPHQIRRSNVHRLQAILKREGIIADTRHLNDALAEITQELAQLLDANDAIILSGGVSKGKFDFIPQALENLGVEKLFHKILQRPGKPFWFGKAPDGARVFALPGNPVSSFMCTCRYFLPWLNASLGQQTRLNWQATLASDVDFKPDLTYFAQVRIQIDADSRLMAVPVQGKGSGDLANLVEADGFLELPRGRDRYLAGEQFTFWPYRSF
ncbi:MAG: molybdopterin molybdotransferase MoeA [Bacteroidota bacterium]